MKIFEQAANPAHDSIEFKLLNVLGCLCLKDGGKLLMSYTRDGGTSITETEVSYKDLECVAPGLTEVIEAICDEYRVVMERNNHIHATCAYLFGAYIDLHKYGFTEARSPFISHVVSIYRPAAPGYFRLQGLCFSEGDINTAGINRVSVSVFGEHTMREQYVEAIWPGSIKAIPLMEDLGYTQQEMIRTLVEGLPIAAPDVPAGLPQFD